MNQVHHIYTFRTISFNKMSNVHDVIGLQVLSETNNISRVIFFMLKNDFFLMLQGVVGRKDVEFM